MRYTFDQFGVGCGGKYKNWFPATTAAYGTAVAFVSSERERKMLSQPLPKTGPKEEPNSSCCRLKGRDRMVPIHLPHLFFWPGHFATTPQQTHRWLYRHTSKVHYMLSKDDYVRTRKMHIYSIAGTPGAKSGFSIDCLHRCHVQERWGEGKRLWTNKEFANAFTPYICRNLSEEVVHAAKSRRVG